MQPFEQITELTDVAEGTIVRVITRLDETCREVRDAARVIGDAELFKKMEESQIKIKRDSEFLAIALLYRTTLLTPSLQLYSPQACISSLLTLGSLTSQKCSVGRQPTLTCSSHSRPSILHIIPLASPI